MARRWSAKLEHHNFNRVYKERQPAVLQASNALQHVIGIEPGTKMIGHLSFKLWDLPVPPEDTMDDIVTRATRKLPIRQTVQATGEDVDCKESDDESEESSDDSEGPEDLLWYPEQGGEMLESTEVNAMYDTADNAKDEENVMPETEDTGNVNTGVEPPRPDVLADQKTSYGFLNQKGKRDDSLPPDTNNLYSTNKKSKVVIDLTESPACATERAPLKALPQPPSQDPIMKSRTERTPASPPAYWQTPLRICVDFGKSPLYCVTDLSKHIAKWLEQHDTGSSEARLSRLELQSVEAHGKSQADVTHIRIYAKDYAKVKITRMTLPTSATLIDHSKSLMDWLIIEVVYIEGTTPAPRYKHGNNNKSNIHQPILISGPPYWLLAFPISAITNSKVEYLKSQPSPLRPQGRRRPQNRPSEQNHMQSTTLVLGKQGKVPLLHGRGVGKKFADDFIRACAEGKAMIVLRSLEAIPFDGVSHHA